MPTKGPSELPWWPAERSSGDGDREPLTRSRIVEAALRLVDRDGLDALSMRRLGQELGAGTTSVYWHVKDKDQLLDLMLDEVLAEIGREVDTSGDWRHLLRSVAERFRAVLVRHRHITPLLGERPTLGPGSIGGLELLFSSLLEAGFTPREAVLASQAVISFGSGWAVFECRQTYAPAIKGRTQADVEAEVAGMMALLPADRYPALKAHGHLFNDVGWDEQFEYAVERMLDGIAAGREPAAR